MEFIGVILIVVFICLAVFLGNLVVRYLRRTIVVTPSSGLAVMVQELNYPIPRFKVWNTYLRRWVRGELAVSIDEQKRSHLMTWSKSCDCWRELIKVPEDFIICRSTDRYDTLGAEMFQHDLVLVPVG